MLEAGFVSIKDEDYINGMEDGINIVKAIFELSLQEREDRFGERSVSTILDRFDFGQIREIMNRKAAVNRYYVIRGVKCTGQKKKVVAESKRYKEYPVLEVIDRFLDEHKEIDFASVEDIYVKELI